MMKTFQWLFLFIMVSCSSGYENNVPDVSGDIQFITVDPGHFHAALVQKYMYDEVDSVVHVYAPDGTDLALHLQRIDGFNNRVDNPANWHTQVYRGDDFFEKMINEKKGNTVVLAGNNRKKTDYILESLEAGLNVYADKPMAIDAEDFEMLKQAFLTADKNGLMLYDIMTERFEITTMLQKELSQIPEIFGTLEKGSPENPAVTKESVHHFFKYVSGKPLVRPAWFFDVEQEGEGLVDVMTHLVDLVQWECFPGITMDYEKDVEIVSARRWPTPLSAHQFEEVTGGADWPDYLINQVRADSVLEVYSNGEINFRLKDVHARTSVTWAYQAPEGAGDTHYSIMRGTKSNLIIRQGKTENYRPVLYLEQVTKDADYDKILTASFRPIQEKFPGVNLVQDSMGWHVVIPEEYHNGHEAHFSQVTEKFIEYFQHRNMPEWEVPNMINKYYITTTALRMASKDE